MTGKHERDAVIVALAGVLVAALGVLIPLTASNPVLRIVLICLLCLVVTSTLFQIMGWARPVIYWARSAFYWVRDLSGRLPGRGSRAMFPQSPPPGFAFTPALPDRSAFTPAPPGGPDSRDWRPPYPPAGPGQGRGVSAWTDGYEADTPVVYPDVPPSNAYEDGEPRLPPGAGLNPAIVLVAALIRVAMSGTSSRRHDPPEHFRGDER